MIAKYERRVHELARPQPRVGVGELSLEIYRAGLRVNRVVDEAQLTGLERTLLLGQRDLHCQLVLGHVLAHGGQLLLGNREIDVDGMHLVDDDHGSVGVGLDEIAGVNEQVTGAAVDRRANLAVLEIQARGLDGSFVGFHRGRQRGSCSLDLIVLLARADILPEQNGIASLVGGGLAILRAILGEIRLGLTQARHRMDADRS